MNAQFGLFTGALLLVLCGIWAGWLIGRGTRVMDNLLERSDSASPNMLTRERVGARLYPRTYASAQRCMTEDLRKGAGSWICNCENCKIVRAELIKRDMLEAWIEGARRRVELGLC